MIWHACCEKQPPKYFGKRKGWRLVLGWLQALWWPRAELLHIGSAELPGEGCGTCGWEVWGDTGLRTPPPGREEKWCWWHPTESDVPANLIRRQVPGVVCSNSRKQKEMESLKRWNEENSKPWLQFLVLVVTSHFLPKAPASLMPN